MAYVDRLRHGGRGGNVRVGPLAAHRAEALNMGSFGFGGGLGRGRAGGCPRCRGGGALFRCRWHGGGWADRSRDGGGEGTPKTGAGYCIPIPGRYRVARSARRERAMPESCMGPVAQGPGIMGRVGTEVGPRYQATRRRGCRSHGRLSGRAGLFGADMEVAWPCGGDQKPNGKFLHCLLLAACRESDRPLCHRFRGVRPSIEGVYTNHPLQPLPPEFSQVEGSSPCVCQT